MFVFRKILRAFFSCYLRFEIRPFALSTNPSYESQGSQTIFSPCHLKKLVKTLLRLSQYFLRQSEMVWQNSGLRFSFCGKIL